MPVLDAVVPNEYRNNSQTDEDPHWIRRKGKDVVRRSLTECSRMLNILKDPVRICANARRITGADSNYDVLLWLASGCIIIAVLMATVAALVRCASTTHRKR
jgi:hypothetical protein